MRLFEMVDLAGKGRASAAMAQNRKPRRGNTGAFRSDDRRLGDSIASHNKQHQAPVVHTHLPNFHNLLDQAAAIGSIRLGSLLD